MLQKRYYDLVNRKQEYAEAKSGDEIVADIVARAGLKVS